MPSIIFLVHASTIMHRKFSTRERTFNGPIFRSSLIDILNRRCRKQEAKMCFIFTFPHCAGCHLGPILHGRGGLLHGQPQQGLLVHLHTQPPGQVTENEKLTS